MRWDNGMEFLAKLVTLLATALCFDAFAVAPYHPMGKGKIERFFRTLQTWALMRLPGYSKGPRTTDKTDVFYGNVEDLLSDEPVIADIRERIDYYIFERPHRKLRA
jgi:transposase InsO family protein